MSFGLFTIMTFAVFGIVTISSAATIQIKEISNLPLSGLQIGTLKDSGSQI